MKYGADGKRDLESTGVQQKDKFQAGKSQTALMVAYHVEDKFHIFVDYFVKSHYVVLGGDIG